MSPKATMSQEVLAMFVRGARTSPKHYPPDLMTQAIAPFSANWPLQAPDVWPLTRGVIDANRILGVKDAIQIPMATLPKYLTQEELKRVFGRQSHLALALYG